MIDQVIFTRSLRIVSGESGNPVATFRPPTSAFGYRADIDGLRAVAVLAVIIYHAGASWFPGGFVGVDVFLVISGYLITGFILQEKQNGRFSISAFYYRRARRIVPALTAVLGGVYAIGWWVLLPDEFQHLGKHVLGAAAFVSNFFLAREAGYFEPAVESYPLLHLWSLAIEEQFYILWPGLLVLLFRLRANLSQWLLVLFLVSLGLSIWGDTHTPVATFYLLPWRAWELLLGAWLACIELNGSGSSVGRVKRILGLIHFWTPQPNLRNAASVFGLILIVGSVFLLNGQSSTRTVELLAPVAGTSILIRVGGAASMNAKILARRPVVFVGLISYSLYLWHWPLLTFSRIKELGPLSPMLAGTVIGVAFVLALLTWRFVEQPFRNKALPVSRARGRLAYGLSIVPYVGILGMIGLLGLLTNRLHGIPERFPAEIASAYRTDEFLTSSYRCQRLNDRKLYRGEECVSSLRSAPTVAVLGDSHATHYFPGIARYLLDRGKVAVLLARSGCAPLPGLNRDDTAGCEGFIDEAIQYIKRDRDITSVILAGRFVQWIEATAIGPDPGVKIAVHSNRYAAGSSNKEMVDASLNEIVLEFARSGKKVVILSQIPEMEIDSLKCLARRIGNCVTSEKQVQDDSEHIWISFKD